ncbi:exodeoxyribonuclease VII large subunit [Oscillospiraceae bacterium OttesenSCG-928-G22]|nr:exodeoxyribonuclease VII large subunit [Oscillospiraceae bacterium OttesenSCG-928-G22]
MQQEIFSVSDVNNRIKRLLDGDRELAQILIRGEISNYRTYPSGHHYYTLKDEGGVLSCVLFRGEASKLKFKPENGMKVIASGRVAVYTRDGRYQLYTNELLPDGVGALHIAFEQLKRKLEEKGMFAEEHKKPIPRYPARVGIVTSSAGAAVRDIIRILKRRYPLAEALLYPVRVQGEEAPPEIVDAIDYMNRHALCDVLIVGRGGGSIEDLWAFNDERVALAIFRSTIPVISAVGHEPDVTIADFVADLRAATPSNAAELAVPDREELKERIEGLKRRQAALVDGRLTRLRERVLSLSERRALKDPFAYLNDRRIQLDMVSARLSNAAKHYLAGKRERFFKLAASLDAMSPLKVLSRGYAIALSEAGAPIRRAADVKEGDRLTLRLSEGGLTCEVVGKEPETA